VTNISDSLFDRQLQTDMCYLNKGRGKKVKVRIALYGLETHQRATERHLPYGITQCYLPPDAGERLTPAMQAGTRFTYPGGMEG